MSDCCSSRTYSPRLMRPLGPTFSGWACVAPAPFWCSTCGTRGASVSWIKASRLRCGCCAALPGPHRLPHRPRPTPPVPHEALTGQAARCVWHLIVWMWMRAQSGGKGRWLVGPGAVGRLVAARGGVVLLGCTTVGVAEIGACYGPSLRSLASEWGAIVAPLERQRQQLTTAARCALLLCPRHHVPRARARTSAPPAERTRLRRANPAATPAQHAGAPPAAAGATSAG